MIAMTTNISTRVIPAFSAEHCFSSEQACMAGRSRLGCKAELIKMLIESHRQRSAATRRPRKNLHPTACALVKHLQKLVNLNSHTKATRLQEFVLVSHLQEA